MLISERIKIHRIIRTTLQASKLLKKGTSETVQNAFNQLKKLDRELRVFNQKHPLFSKLIWILDHFFGFYPLKLEMARLRKLQIKIAKAIPIVQQLPPKPSDPPYIELLALLQSELYKKCTTTQDETLIDAYHFILQSSHSLHQVSMAFEKAKKLQVVPQTPATQNAYNALIHFRNALTTLIQKIKLLKNGKKAEEDTQKVLTYAVNQWNALKLPLLAIKVMLENNPTGNPFDPIIKSIIYVENCLDKKVIEARRILEKKICHLLGKYRNEKNNLTQRFAYYPDFVQMVIRAQMRSYKKEIRLHANAHLALNFSLEISNLSICKTIPDENPKEKEYQEFIQKCSDNKIVTANLFLPYASETLQRIREYSRISLKYRNEVKEVLQKGGVQAHLRLHTKLHDQ